MRTGRRIRMVVMVTTLLIGVVATSPTTSRPASALGLAGPIENFSGQSAVDRFRSSADATATRLAVPRATIEQALRAGTSLRTDATGSLFAVDPPDRRTTTQEVESAAGLLPAAESGVTFKMHSRPGSRRTIYLDFDGHVTTGSRWNSILRPVITSTTYSADDDPSGFGGEDLARIGTIWNRVAEDFRIFDVDVTTEEPAASTLARSSSRDDVYGIRVVITPDNFWDPGNAGGVAFLDSFSDTRYAPAFVFTTDLSNSWNSIAEAASHEAGHTLGLLHDGDATNEYHRGGAAWAPIMGNSYSAAVTQWSKGEYANANNAQDDISTMSTSDRIPLIPDDHGDVDASATSLGGIAGTGTRTGVISSWRDVDVFKVRVTGTGDATFSVRSNGSNDPNLRPELTVWRDGTTRAGTSTYSGMDVTVTTRVTSGTYYLRIRGTGSGSSSAGGYSSYASVGYYTVSSRVPVGIGGPVRAPFAVITTNRSRGPAPMSVVFSSTGSFDSDGTIVAREWDFGDGSTGSGERVSHRYDRGGVYTATLRVVDDQGNTGSTTRTITVTSTSYSATVAVYRILGGSTLAKVTIVPTSGPVPAGIVVRAAWSGIVKRSVVATVAADGTAAFVMSRPPTAGRLTFTVVDVEVPSPGEWDGTTRSGSVTY